MCDENETVADLLREAAGRLDDGTDDEDEYTGQSEWTGLPTKVVYDDRWVTISKDPAGDFYVGHDSTEDDIVVTDDNDFHAAIREFVDG